MVEYRWGIYWANLDPVMNSEQAGRRPVIVVSAEEVNRALPVLTVVPLSSARPGRKVYPTEVLLKKEDTGLPRDSIAMVHQIRTVPKRRLEERCGFVSDVGLRGEVKSCILRQLAL